MSAELKGFIEIPVGSGRVAYLRLSSIDAVWVNSYNTLIQVNGCTDSDDFFVTSLKLNEVIALMIRAQDG